MKQTKLKHVVYLGEFNGCEYEVECYLEVAPDIDWNGNYWIGLEDFTPAWLYIDGNKLPVNEQSLEYAVRETTGMQPEALWELLEEKLQHDLDNDMVDGAYS